MEQPRNREDNLARLAGMRTILVPALAALLVVSACAAAAGPSAPAPSDPPAAFDPNGAWELVEGSADGQPLPLVEDARVTLIVEGSSVGGQSACNQYFGAFTVVDGRVTLGGLGGTEMACAEPVMALEAAYHAALVKVQAASMDGDALVLSGPDVELRFERLEPPPMA